MEGVAGVGEQMNPSRRRESKREEEEEHDDGPLSMLHYVLIAQTDGFEELEEPTPEEGDESPTK